MCGIAHLVYFVADTVIFQLCSAVILASPVMEAARWGIDNFPNAEGIKLIAL